MQAVASEVYGRINNDYYNGEGDRWWKPDSALYLLKTSVNPVRVAYSRKKLKELNIDPVGKKALEVGSGGGILCEEIANMGFDAYGIDPSEQSLEVATNHARVSGLNINYQKGSGEAIPFEDETFDVVFCCDVLEHVRDLPKVISEIARVLKPGGAFIYDTINRTFVSKLVAIKIWQEWKRWAFMPANLHVWKMFIKPKELIALLQQSGLEWKEHKGTEPNVSIPAMLKYLRKRAKGEWTYKELGDNFVLVESNDLNLLYMGYAIKK